MKRRTLLAALLAPAAARGGEWPPDTSATPQTLPADDAGRLWLAWTGPGPGGRGAFLRLQDANGRRTPVLFLRDAYEPVLRAPSGWRAGGGQVTALAVSYGAAAREVTLLALDKRRPVVLATRLASNATWDAGRDGRDRLRLWRPRDGSELLPRCFAWTGRSLAEEGCP